MMMMVMRMIVLLLLLLQFNRLTSYIAFVFHSRDSDIRNCCHCS